MITEALYSAYLSALLNGDKPACHETVTALLADEVNLLDLYLHLFQRSMYDVGVLWEQNKVSVATEHLATMMTEGLLHLVYPKLFQIPTQGNTVVISCVANEYHQLGGRMVADMFSFYGWDSYFLGANTPIGDLIQFIDAHQPNVLGLSLSLYSRLPQLINAIRDVHLTFPKLDIVVGGQAFVHSTNDVLAGFSNVELIQSIRELQNYVDSFAA